MTKNAELFLSDIHGEYEPFAHIVRSGCGTVKAAIDEAFGAALAQREKDELATLVCYPEEKLPQLLEAGADKAALREKLVALCGYFEADAAGDACIAKLCRAIQVAAVSQLHVVGDVYDRGPSPDLIMDELAAYPNLDVQWGNHDIVWMGASLGQLGCVATAVRICARYANLSVLEKTYGMDLTPLRDFANSVYAADPCTAFGLKGSPELSPEELQETIRIQKAMAIIQFKVEAKLIDENPSFELENRKLLHCIDFEKGTVLLDGVEHELQDNVFLTVDPKDPYALTAEEEAVISYLQQAFMGCEKLQRHIAVFMERGSLYKIVGDTLLFHACVPLNEDGSLKEVTLFGKTLKGKALFDEVDALVRAAFTAQDETSKKRGCDMLWYLWLGAGSPLFAKSKMATFEIYYVASKAARKEAKNAFYTLYENEEVVKGILEDFGVDPKAGRIVCGHVPVKVKDGENPCKCGGKVVVIDGGMSRAYQSKTGIAGLAIKNDGAKKQLIAFAPFPPAAEVIANNLDIEQASCVEL